MVSAPASAPRGQRDLQQIVGGRVARIGLVHRGGRDAEQPQRPRLAVFLARQGMRRMRRLHALGCGIEIDVEHAVLLAQIVARHDRRNARPRLAGLAMEHPVMPGADDVAVVAQLALAERPAGMIAAAGDRAELSVAIAERDRHLVDGHLAQRLLLQLIDRAEGAPTLRHDCTPFGARSCRSPNPAARPCAGSARSPRLRAAACSRCCRSRPNRGARPLMFAALRSRKRGGQIRLQHVVGAGGAAAQVAFRHVDAPRSRPAAAAPWARSVTFWPCCSEQAEW